MNNIARIQKRLIENNLDAVLITDEKNQRFAVGFPFTDGAVLISRSKAWLITDSRYIEAAENASAAFAEVRLCDREHSLISLIRSALNETGAVRIGAEEEKLSHNEYIRLEKQLETEFFPAQYIFTSLRASKTPEELEYMRQAQEISEKALEEVLHIIRPGMTEREVAAELVYHMLRFGAEGCSFDPIVVTGAKTSMPHGVPSDMLICDGDFVTMDFGCIKNGYCSDMTRTVAIGSVSDEMRNVYHTVLEAQLAGIAAAHAGVTGKDIDGAARSVIEAAGYGKFFGHGFGHSLGLDIHESPSANPRNESPMPVGSVISAEPGIYLPGKFGVRIEDVIVLTESGCENITKAPKELSILRFV